MPFEINWTPIVIGIAAFFIGYLFAILDRRVTASIRSHEERKESKERVRVVERVVPEPSALRVVEEGDRVRIVLDGTTIEPTSITASQRKRLIALLVHFRPFVDRKAAAPSHQPASSPPKTTAPPSQPASPSPGPVASSPPPATAIPPVGAGDVPKPLSIIEQIDSILQVKLASSPLAERGIRLVEALDGSVHIWVDKELYKAVDEIPDPSIQAIIREAIAEWERHSTTGL